MFHLLVPYLLAHGYVEAPPPIFWICLISMMVPLVIIGLSWIYGLYGGLRTLQGGDSKYLVLGPMIERSVPKD